MTHLPKLRLLVAMLFISVAACQTAEPVAEPTGSAAETTSAPSPVRTATTAPAAPAPPAAAEVLLDIAVFDDTNRRAPEAEVWVRGSGSWYPELEFGGDMRQFGTYSVGQPGEFFVYPDGRGGREIRVEFEMQPEMISGSTQARTVVEIRDQRVRVWGQAIPGNEAVYDR